MNVRPSREVTLHSHRHGAPTRHALRSTWPLMWMDTARLLALVMLVLAIAAALASLPLVALTSPIDSIDRRVATTAIVTEGSAPHGIALAVTAPTSSVSFAVLIAALALGRLRRWHVWRPALTVAVPAAVAVLAVEFGSIEAGPWAAEQAGHPSGHTAFAVVLGGAISLSELDDRTWRQLCSWSLTIGFVAVAGWGGVALGSARFSDTVAGLLVGATALVTSHGFVVRVQRRHLDRVLEREFVRWSDRG